MREPLSRVHRLPMILSLVKAQLLLLLVTGFALIWFQYSRKEAAQRERRLNQILLVSLSGGEDGAKPVWDLFRMNPDGSGKTNLTHDDILEIDPVWSPDARQIAFAAMTEP